MIQTLKTLAQKGNFTKITLDKDSYMELKKARLIIRSPILFKNTTLNALTIGDKSYQIIVKYSYIKEIFIKFE